MSESIPNDSPAKEDVMPDPVLNEEAARVRCDWFLPSLNLTIKVEVDTRAERVWVEGKEVRLLKGNQI